MPSLPTPGVTTSWGDDLNAAIESLNSQGTHAARPASGIVTGSLYSCSDHDTVYRWNGSAWANWVDPSLWISAGALGAASGGPLYEAVGGIAYWTVRDGFTDEVSAEVLIPPGWTQINITLVWFSQNGAAGNVALHGKIQAHADGNSVGFAGFAGTGAVVAAGGSYVAKHTQTAAGVAVTAGAPTHISIFRDGTAAGDTSAGNVGILGVRIDRAA